MLLRMQENVSIRVWNLEIFWGGMPPTRLLLEITHLYQNLMKPPERCHELQRTAMSQSRGISRAMLQCIWNVMNSHETASWRFKDNVMNCNEKAWVSFVEIQRHCYMYELQSIVTSQSHSNSMDSHELVSCQLILIWGNGILQELLSSSQNVISNPFCFKHKLSLKMTILAHGSVITCS